MTELRQRMIQDMILAGLALTTQANYVRAVAQLASRYGVSPDRLTEEQVRRRLLDLIEVQNAARGTYHYKPGSIRFFYVQTRGRDRRLFYKLNSGLRSRRVCRDPSRMAIFSP